MRMVTVKRSYTGSQCEVPGCFMDSACRLLWLPAGWCVAEGRDLCQQHTAKVLAAVSRQDDGKYRFSYSGVEFESRSASAIEELASIF